MTKNKEPTGRDLYPDIIDHPHWQSKKHPHMSLYDRAAQFAPFSALTGYDDMVQEEGRLTDTRIELTSDEKEILNRKLSVINDAIRNGQHPTLTITYFIPDKQKDGGRYETVVETIKRIDVVRGKLVLLKTDEINLRDILDISGELVNHL